MQRSLPSKSCHNFPSREDEIFERAHLLEVLYYALLPSSSDEEMVVEIRVEKGEQKDGNNEGSCENSSNLLMNKLSNFMSAPIRYLNKAATSNKFSAMVKLPCLIMKRITMGSAANAIQDLVASAAEVAQDVEKVESEDTLPIEEISIPSVSELRNVGIRFRPSNGGLNTIKFDKATATFTLPVIVINEKSEVVIRNLVAYEASIAPEMTPLSRYTELMNGIIDTEEDVKLLREAGIILNKRKSDMEVANLWNGMSRSVKPTKVPVLDDAIEKINAYYSSKLKVRAGTIVKKFVLGSWKFLIFFGAYILLLLTGLEAFCSVYKCKSISFS